MIQIEKRNGNWEASYGGGLLCWNADLATVIRELRMYAESIEEQESAS